MSPHKLYYKNDRKVILPFGMNKVFMCIHIRHWSWSLFIADTNLFLSELINCTDWMTRVQLPAEAEIFLFATTSRPALEPTEPPA